MHWIHMSGFIFVVARSEDARRFWRFRRALGKQYFLFLLDDYKAVKYVFEKSVCRINETLVYPFRDGDDKALMYVNTASKLN